MAAIQVQMTVNCLNYHMKDKADQGAPRVRVEGCSCTQGRPSVQGDVSRGLEEPKDQPCESEYAAWGTVDKGAEVGAAVRRPGRGREQGDPSRREVAGHADHVAMTRTLGSTQV